MGEVDWVLPGAHRLRVDISLTNGISSSTSGSGSDVTISTNAEIYRSMRSILRDTFEWGDREPITDIRVRRDKAQPTIKVRYTIPSTKRQSMNQ
jgi:hypothetical protein